MARVRLGSGVLLVGRPGVNNVESLPPGHDSLSFDSRIEDFGIIYRQGVVNWAGSPTVVSFPTMAYTPLASIMRIDGSNQIIHDDFVGLAGSQVGQVQGLTTPYVATVTPSSLSIYHFSNPYWSVPNPGGRFLYTIYAIQV